MNKKIFLFILIFTTLLSLPRFAHHTPDSQFYIDEAKFFQGKIPYGNLVTPYAYRVLLPFLAAHGPTSDLDFNFAVINLACTIVAYLVFYSYLKSLFSKETEIAFGMIILVVSFPTANYASGVLTDPIGFLLFVAGAYFFLKEQFLIFSIIVSIGTLAREANLSLILALLIYILATFRNNPCKKLALLLVGIPPLLAYFEVRQYFSSLPGYFWFPSLIIVWQNITSLVSWETFLFVLLPPIVIMTFGLILKQGINSDFRKTPRNSKAVLISLTGACVSLIIYSILTAFMSGRFVWPFYVVLIPVAVISIRKLQFYVNKVEPLLEKIFSTHNIYQLN